MTTRTKDFLKQTPSGMVVNLGKHEGKELLRVAQEDPKYLLWVIQKFENLPEMTKLVIEQALDDHQS
ncbi:hypothetical protein EBZ38_08430 [bacterium]|nr:hypothetical protein [bacterium]